MIIIIMIMIICQGRLRRDPALRGTPRPDAQGLNDNNNNDNTNNDNNNDSNFNININIYNLVMLLLL